MMQESKKRVLVFSTNYFPNIGGAEVAIKEITDRLPNYTFELICARLETKLPSEEKVGNVLVHRLGFGSSLDKLLIPFWGVFKIWQINHSRPVKLFWSVMVSYASCAAYFYNAFKFWRPIPAVLTLQEGDSEEHLTKRYFGLLDMTWRLSVLHSNVVTALSNYLANRARRFGYRGEPYVVPNGVSDDYFTERKTRDDGKTIITTSRLVHKNGVDTLVRAMALLPKHNLLIAGDGKERKNLEALVKELKIGSRVKFLGTVSREDLPKLLSSADIFCRPSRSEGQGVSFMEAMAVGLPVIAPPVGGIPDFLRDPSTDSGQAPTGLFCQVDDPESIAEKVRLLASDKNLRIKIIGNAKKLMIDKYRWLGIAESMGQVFETVVTNKPTILLAAGIYPPDPGGPALHAQRYFEEFPKHGFSCRLVSFRDYRKYPKGISHFLYTCALARTTMGADIIYAFDTLSSGVPSLIISTIFRIPFVVRIGGDALWERATEISKNPISLTSFYQYSLHRGKLNFYIIFIVVSAAKKIIVPAQILKDIYIKHYGIKNSDIIVVPNPI